MSGEFLLEVRTEEIPARMLGGAARELATRVFEELMARGVSPTEVEAGFTPRRLWLVLKGLPEREEDRWVVEIGPPGPIAFDDEGKPTRAGIGFAKKHGVEPSDLLRKTFSRNEDHFFTGSVLGETTRRPVRVQVDGDRAYVEYEVKGARVAELLADWVPRVLKGLSWAKTMKWGAGVGPWVRPVHGVVALLDGEVLPFEFFDVASGRTTVGHPTLSPEPFDVDSVEAWRKALAERGIEPSADRREARLRAGMEAAATTAGGSLVDDPALLAKLAAICEIPGVLEGRLDDALLGLPREVLITSLRDHQSALTVERDGALLPHFLTVMDRPDDPKGRVRAGNEWVVAARLADAVFFWDKDRKVRLEERKVRVEDREEDALKGLVFHRDLGSYWDKWGRIDKLTREFADDLELTNEEKLHLSRASRLAKCDLVTDMVREFTDLQGVMGGIYAREQGEPEAVWKAVRDQYRPVGTDDDLPETRLGRILALADRLDTLVGFFALGLVPTGSRDPFGLRRSATGVIRLLAEEGTRIDLAGACSEAHREFGKRVKRGWEETWTDLRPFFEDRIRHLLELEGFEYDEIEAALRRRGETLAYVGPLRDLVAAIHEERKSDAFVSVVRSAKRISNILRGQPKHELRVEQLKLDLERQLAEAGSELGKRLAEVRGSRDYAASLRRIGDLAPLLEQFFNEVLVMDEDADVRANRLALLQSIDEKVSGFADLSQLVIDGSS